MKYIFLKIILGLVTKVLVVNSECDGYSNCIEDVYKFLNNNDNISKNNEIKYETVALSDDFQTGDDDINDLIDNVSRLLQKEIEKNLTDILHSFEDDKTNIYVQSINVNEPNDHIGKLLAGNIQSTPDNGNFDKLATGNIHNTPKIDEELIKKYTAEIERSSIIDLKNIQDTPDNDDVNQFNVFNDQNIPDVSKFLAKTNQYSPYVSKLNVSRFADNQNTPDIGRVSTLRGNIHSTPEIDISKIIADKSHNTPKIDDELIKKLTADLEESLKTHPHNLYESQIVGDTIGQSVTPTPIKDIRENEIDNIDANLSKLYEFDEDNSTDYPVIDYIEYYKDTTNEDVDLTPTENYNDSSNDHVAKNPMDDINNGDNITSVETIRPWIAAIYIRSEQEHFNYYCDGALLSENAVLTSARCVRRRNMMVNATEILVVLGKTSLQTMSDTEKVVNVVKVIPHEDFNATKKQNDIAILEIENIVPSDAIKVARLGNEQEFTESFTTGWDSKGDFSVIYLKNNSTKSCVSIYNNAFCTIYGQDVAVCPSFGGLYVAKHNGILQLQGIRIDDPTKQELCANEPVNYISLHHFSKWFKRIIK